MLRILAFLTLAFFWYMMLNIVLPYTSGETDIDFLQTKQHIIHLAHYRWAFYLHIFSSLYILAAGLTQFTDFTTKKNLSLHRIIGKGYVFLILFVSAPAGFIMSYYANGNSATQFSFMLLSVCWFAATWKAYDAIKNQKNIASHRRWMIRIYALTLSAITLRIMQFFIANYIEILSPEEAYNLIAYPSWILNVLIAEIYIRFSPDFQVE